MSHGPPWSPPRYQHVEIKNGPLISEREWTDGFPGSNSNGNPVSHTECSVGEPRDCCARHKILRGTIWERCAGASSTVPLRRMLLVIFRAGHCQLLYDSLKLQVKWGESHREPDLEENVVGILPAEAGRGAQKAQPAGECAGIE